MVKLTDKNISTNLPNLSVGKNEREKPWDKFARPFFTGRPSSKYEHRRASALLGNIQNIRIHGMGKKPIVSVTYENERISIKNSLPYLKCLLRLSCVVHGSIYGRFMGFSM